MKVTVKSYPKQHQVWMAYKHQSFPVGPEYPTKKEAEWYARMLKIALEKWKKDAIK